MFAKAARMLMVLVAAASLTVTAKAGDGLRGDAARSGDPARIIGIVEGGRLMVVFPEASAPGGLRLTRIQRQEARSVESGEIDLSGHEGAAIMAEGVRDSGWLYEARIIDRGGPLLTALVREVFARRPR